MGSSRLVGVMCTDCETRYPEGVSDPPCLKCGSVRRTFLQYNSGEVKAEGTVEWLRRGEQQQVLGYGDTGRHGTVRHGNLEQDDTVSLLIEGRPPRNEEDTGRVLATLAAAMSSAERFASSVSGDQDVDGRVTSASRGLDVQVVRALSQMQFWRKLASVLRVSQRITPGEAADFLKHAIAHKSAQLPARQRKQLVLALDADRLPALALEPVALEFRRVHGGWCAAQEFVQVWLVGPDPALTWLLDGERAGNLPPS